MVDVSHKTATPRTAVASAIVTMQPESLALLRGDQLPKGNVLTVARIAGINAAKRTSDLIPLCHPLPIESVQIDFDFVDDSRIKILATVSVTAKTGVEMEALSAAAVAALTIYDMTKAVDKAIILGPIQLESKAGGRSGTYQRSG